VRRSCSTHAIDLILTYVAIYRCSLSLSLYLQADHIEESVAYELMELMDLNGDGVIDFSEFCKGWLTFQSKFDADEAATAAAGN
jgi:hypothetical protein